MKTIKVSDETYRLIEELIRLLTDFQTIVELKFTPDPRRKGDRQLRRLRIARLKKAGGKRR
jgi:hypothetical protein